MRYFISVKFMKKVCDLLAMALLKYHFSRRHLDIPLIVDPFLRKFS